MQTHNPKLARRYARALFDITPPNDCERVHEGLAQLASLIETDRPFRDAVFNPAYPIDERLDAVRAVTEYLIPGSVLMGNFMGVLLQNGRVGLLRGVTEAYGALIAELKKILALEVSSAFPLPEAERAALLQRIQREYGTLATIAWKLDPDMLGGMRVRSGDKLFDASVRASLERAREVLTA